MEPAPNDVPAFSPVRRECSAASGQPLVALMCDTKRLRGAVGACGSDHRKSEMCAFKSGGANWFFAGLQGCPRTQGATQGWVTPVRMGD